MRKNLNGYSTNDATQSGAIGGLGANPCMGILNIVNRIFA